MYMYRLYRLYAIFVAIYVDSMLTQVNTRQPEVAFCFMSGATYTQTIRKCLGASVVMLEFNANICFYV
jgi:hypothetical protein